jgi:hypothetical protein
MWARRCDRRSHIFDRVRIKHQFPHQDGKMNSAQVFHSLSKGSTDFLRRLIKATE